MPWGTSRLWLKRDMNSGLMTTLAQCDAIQTRLVQERRRPNHTMLRDIILCDVRHFSFYTPFPARGVRQEDVTVDHTHLAPVTLTMTLSALLDFVFPTVAIEGRAYSLNALRKFARAVWTNDAAFIKTLQYRLGDEDRAIEYLDFGHHIKRVSACPHSTGPRAGGIPTHVQARPEGGTESRGAYIVGQPGIGEDDSNSNTCQV